MAASASGHVEQLPSGSYRVNVYSGTDPLTGRRLRHRETAKTRHQAQILLGRLLEQADAGRRPDTTELERLWTGTPPTSWLPTSQARPGNN
jgi:hypothetical protein